MKNYTVQLTALIAVTLTPHLRADVITGVSAEYTSETADFSSLTSTSEASYNVDAIVDGTGLTGTGTSATHANLFLNSNGTFLHDNALTNPSENSTIVFDLGASYDLSSLNVWNYNSAGGSTARGIASVTVETSPDGIAYGFSSTLNFAQANAPDNTPAQVIAFVASGVQFIRFTNIANFSGGSDNPGGIAEIQFDGIVSGTKPSEFAITEIVRDGNLVTLTWDSEENRIYAVRFSKGLINWDSDLDDAVSGDPGDETTRTFDLTDFSVEDEEDLFFRVETG